MKRKPKTIQEFLDTPVKDYSMYCDLMKFRDKEIPISKVKFVKSHLFQNKVG